MAMGPLTKGSLITAKEEVSILNLNQSYLDNGMNNWAAKKEASHRVQFGIKSAQRNLNI